MRPESGRFRPELLACVVCLLALAVPAGAAARFPSTPWNRAWCARLSGDSVCRWRGQVRVADRVGAALGPDELLPPRRSRLIGGEGTRVMTGPNAEARLLFRNRARCSLGGNGQAGEYFAHPREEVLFNQFLGYSSCTSIRGGANSEVSVLCSPEERCPVTMRWNGTYFVKSEAPEATASITDTYVRRARIVVCSGSIRVRAETENSFAESSGQAGSGSRWLIVVEETTTTTYDESSGATGSSDSVQISVSQRRRGRGPCASSSIEEQEHTVTP